MPDPRKNTLSIRLYDVAITQPRTPGCPNGSAAGFALTAVLWGGAPELRLLGPAAVLCGALGTGSAVRQSLITRREYLALTQEQQKERAAWEVLLQAAPKKEGDNDLTYIPVTDKVLTMKNGDLMIEYHLLPAIAVQAWERLHEK